MEKERGSPPPPPPPTPHPQECYFGRVFITASWEADSDHRLISPTPLLLYIRFRHVTFNCEGEDSLLMRVFVASENEKKEAMMFTEKSKIEDCRQNLKKHEGLF